MLYCDDCESVSTGRFRCFPDGRITRPESSEEEEFLSESSEDEEIGLLMLGHNATVITDPPPPHSPPHTRREPTPPPLYEEIDTTPPPVFDQEPQVQSFVCATFEPTRFIYNTNGLDLSKYNYYVKWGTLYVEIAPDDIREFSAIREEEDDMKFPIKTAHFNEDEIDEGEHWE